MRRRTWHLAIIALLGVLALRFIASRRSTHFDGWARYENLPDAVPRGRVTRVQIVGAEGQPASGARLFVAGDQFAAPLLANEAGMVMLDTAASRVVFASSGAEASRLAFLDEVVPDGGVVLRLVPGARLEALVLTADGVPAPGVRVSHGTWKALDVTSDDAGAAHFPAVPAGEVMVIAHVNGQTAFEWASLEEGKRTEVVIALERTCELRGVVDDEAGPVPDARIELRSLIDDSVLAETRADDAGWFSTRMRASAALIVRASAAGHGLQETAAVPGCAPVHLSLPRGVTAGVEVVDATGRAIPAAAVRLRPRARSRWLLSGSTDRLGRFETTLTASPWFAEATFDGEAATVESALPPDGGGVLHLSFPEELRRITGHVADAKSGAPIAGATIGDELSDEAGDFTLHLLGSGERKVGVSAWGYAPGRFTSSRDGEHHRVLLERRDWTIVSVADERGVGLTEITVDGLPYESVEGQYVLSHRDDHVTVAARGFEPARLELQEERVELRLARAAPIDVLVLGADGGPAVANVMEDIDDGEPAISRLRRGELTGRGSSDLGGRARVFSGGGCLRAAEYPWLPSPCVSPDGGTLVLRLGIAGAVAGFVEGGVTRLQLDTDEAATLSQADGSFRLFPVTPGVRRLGVVMPSGAVWHRDLTVGAGAVTTVRLVEAPDAGASVRVLVEGAVERVLISVRGPGSAASVDELPAGEVVEFTFHGLAEGPHEIVAAEGERRASTTAFLSATPHEVKLTLPQ